MIAACTTQATESGLLYFQKFLSVNVINVGAFFDIISLFFQNGKGMISN